jgi:predicted N-acetyltransferase YhbS
VRIRQLRVDDLPAADALRRLAFGTFLELPDPTTFRGDASPVRTRYLADPAGSFAAEVDGDLVGSNFVVDWGSVGFFGPLSVHPDFWNRGIAQRLVEASLETFTQRGIRHVGLFTFAHSAQHLMLYQKYGFWPRYLTLIMARNVGQAPADIAWSAYSRLSETEAQEALSGCRALADAWYGGLDLGVEIQATVRHRFGETILLRDGDTLTGFAVCHSGPDTEAGSRNCYVKFGAVRPGPDVEVSFARLLAACEALAMSQGMARLVAGVNTARREAYRVMLAAGFRPEVQGLAMDRPDEAGYNRPGVAIIDDWR